MNRPASISIKDLSGAVKKAVSTVAAKEKIQLEPQLHIGPIITGIILRPQELPQAERIANDLTGHIKASAAGLGGTALEPGVLIAGGRIICGFIAPEVAFHE
jgi:hypothetical protein